MKHWIVILSATTAIAGCSKPAKTPVQVAPALVRWRDVSGTNSAGVRNDYLRLRPGPTINLFPSSLAVARTTTFTGNPDGRMVPSALSKLVVSDQIGWTELFDDRWEIASVYPLPYPGADQYTVTPSDLVARAREIGANLCLVYRMGGSGPYTALARGALYDTRSGEVLAGIHCEETVDPLAARTAPTPPAGVEGDLSNVDATMLVMDRFRRVIRRCVLDFIASDRNTVIPPPPFGHDGPNPPTTHLQDVAHRTWR